MGVASGRLSLEMIIPERKRDGMCRVFLTWESRVFVVVSLERRRQESCLLAELENGDFGSPPGLLGVLLLAIRRRAEYEEAIHKKE